MPLYSSDSLSNGETNVKPETAHANGKKVNLPLACGDESPWFYLYTSRFKVDKVEAKLKERYQTFIHKTILYSRREKQIVKEEKPSISGLIFVRGESGDEIQKYINMYFTGIYLVKSRYTKKYISVSHKIMLPFMKVAEVSSDKIRFMPNSIGHYSQGNTLVKVTSGVLSGLEGYVVRIAREKRLVLSVGNMTVAISGVYKETFENADEYIDSRKRQETVSLYSKRAQFTPVQLEIDKCFFQVKSRIDILAIDKSLDKWILHAKSLVINGKYDEAIDILFFILKELGSNIGYKEWGAEWNSIKDVVSEICNSIIKILTTIEKSSDVPEKTKTYIQSEKDSVLDMYPFCIGLSPKK